MKFVILTGMSGAGKSTALKMMEDIGFYCVDNLPIPLVEKFVELSDASNAELQKVAVGIDIRSDQRRMLFPRKQINGLSRHRPNKGRFTMNRLLNLGVRIWI